MNILSYKTGDNPHQLTTRGGWPMVDELIERLHHKHLMSKFTPIRRTSVILFLFTFVICMFHLL